MMDFRVRALRVKADLFQFRGRQRPNKALEPTAVGVAYFSLELFFFLHHSRRRLSLSVRQNQTIMKRELLTIEDSFAITNRGIVLMPHFPVPHGEWKHRVEVVTILPPDSPPYDTTASFELTHFSIRDPNVSADMRWRIVLIIRDTTKERLPKGSRICVSAETYELLTRKTEPNKALEPTRLLVTDRAPSSTLRAK
jgi:hypothetical protein